VLKSCVGARLGAPTDGAEGLAGANPLEDGLERIVAGGLLGVNERCEGVNERGALGVKDGREGAIERGALGVNDGLEGAAAGGELKDGLDGAIERDPPELDGKLWLRDDPELGLELGPMDSRLAPMLCMAEPRLERPCAIREPDDPISRAAVSATDIMPALRSFLPPARNMAVSFPSPAACDLANPLLPPTPTCLIVGCDSG